MSTYDKIYQLFESQIKGDCSKKITRTLLLPVITFFEMYEKERCADARQEIFREACADNQLFQWYYWSVEDNYGGVGEWREFPPVCVSQLNRAVRENKTSIRLTVAQRTYLIDFNEMSRRLSIDSQPPGFHPFSQAPIFAKANLRDGFSVENLIMRLNELNASKTRHSVIISGILKLIKSGHLEPLDTELASAALALLLRLITFSGMAEEFIKGDGPQTLLQMRYAIQSTGKSGINVATPTNLVSLIIRHCIEESDHTIVQNAFEQMIRSTCNGNPISLLESTSRRQAMRTRRYQKDWKRVMRLLTPFAMRSTGAYVKMMEKCLMITKNELQLKEKEEKEQIVSANISVLNTVLNQIVTDLKHFEKGTGNANESFNHRLIQPAHLLKLIAELMRSYSVATNLFVDVVVEGQPIIRWLIEHFLLSTDGNNQSEIAIWAKAVLTELVSCTNSPRVTDQLVGEIKALLHSALDEHANNVCGTQITSSSLKLAEKVNILAKLTIHLRDCVQSNNHYSTGSTKHGNLLLKSMYKRNLANDFVKTIWSIPLHEKQGTETVNTLLKLFEGMIGAKHSAVERDRDGAATTHQQHGVHMYHDEDAHEEDDEDTQEINARMEVDGREESFQHETNEDEEGGHLDGETAADATISGMDQSRDDLDLREHEQNEPDVDDEQDSEDEEMDTAEEAALHQEQAEGGEEGPIDDDHVSEADPNEDVRVPNPIMVADDEVDEMDEDDDDEEEDDEEEDNDDTLAEIEDALADYYDMADIQDLANEVQTIGHDIRRINMNLNAVAAQQFHQAIIQHIPRNIRTLLGHHPRGHVLRIRGDPTSTFTRNMVELDRIGANLERAGGAMQYGRDSIVTHILSHFSGNGPIPSVANGIYSEDRHVPFFLDRISDWCRLIDPFSSFLLGTIISSYLFDSIQVPPEEPVAKLADVEMDQSKEDGQLEAARKEATEQQPTNQEEDNTMQQDQASAESDAIPPPEPVEETDLSAQLRTPPQEAQTEEVTIAPRGPADLDSGAQLTPQQMQPNVEESVVPEGVDPAFLAALPEDMRQEVIRDHLLQQQINQTANGVDLPNDQPLPPDRVAALIGVEIPEGMDPAFLAALPEDIFHEVVRDHQRQQELARQRAAQRQAQVAAQQVHQQQHIHHHAARHFPRYLGHRRDDYGWMREALGSRAAEGTSAPAQNVSAERIVQLFDRESICTLLMLYLVDHEKYDIARLQKLLKLICAHPGTCDFTVWALLGIVDGLDRFDSLDSAEESAGYSKFQSGWINQLRLSTALDRHERVLRLTPSNIHINQQIRSVAAQRIVDTIGFLARTYPRHFMPKPIRSPTGKIEGTADIGLFWNILHSINFKAIDEMRKEKTAVNLHEVVPDALEKSPFAHIFLLINSNLAKESQPLVEKFLKIVFNLSQTIPCNFNEKMSNESKKWLSGNLRTLTNILAECSTEEALRDGRAFLVEILRAVPAERSSILNAVHNSIQSRGKQLEQQLSGLKVDLTKQKDSLEKMPDLLKQISGHESTPKRLLKSLETVHYLCSHLKKMDEAQKRIDAEAAKKSAAVEQKKESGTSGQETANLQGTSAAAILEQEPQTSSEGQNEEPLLMMRIVDELKPLWDTLSECLEILEKTEDSQHAVLCLQRAAEAFFLCYSLIIPPAQIATSIETSEAHKSQNQPSTSPINSTTKETTFNKYQKEMFGFAEKHRTVLNQILRGNTNNLESSAFAILTHFPKLLDFDVKRKYFYKELKKLDERNRYRHEDIAIRVRRSHLFGDSFRELYRLRPSDWKARLYIIFEGEEGQDAGGLLREWYSIITREIFNPNYALFINAPGDRVTYMINKSSYVNPEHLDYFRFVGRVIAKAIYDNKQLDCYFTRAFYKHILNIHVRYQDIESEDPDLFKSLEFLLDNSVEDLGTELTFSVEVEEFGVRSTRQLKEDGLKSVVTDASKQEYVHLMCQMKMTGSIRQQLNAFLDGFYEIIPKKLISIFNEQELELLISGLPVIDIDDLCANTEYKTYTRTSPQIQWFWRALKSFDQEDKAKFLQFVTGTSKVPLQGFSHLEGMNGVQKFTIQKDTRSADRLPSAHTCFNQLDLPEYADYETLQKMLLLASRECSEGFAFA